MDSILKRTSIPLSYLMLTILGAFALLTGCTDLVTGYTNDGKSSNKLQQAGKSALILVMEEKQGGYYPAPDESAYLDYKNKALPIFSELFGVPESQLSGFQLQEILEIYGVPWKINQITKHAIGKYDTVIVLNGIVATIDNLNNKMLELSDMGYTLDLVLCVQGNNTSFFLHNYDEYYISDFANFVKTDKIRLRVLYQSWSEAGQTLTTWAESGIYAVNGAAGNNSVSIFSPGYFMEEWVSGIPFDQAVQDAYIKDIEKIRSYDNRIPLTEYLLTPDNLNESIQLTGGQDKKITFIQFPG